MKTKQEIREFILGCAADFEDKIQSMMREGDKNPDKRQELSREIALHMGALAFMHMFSDWYVNKGVFENAGADDIDVIADELVKVVSF